MKILLYFSHRRSRSHLGHGLCGNDAFDRLEFTRAQTDAALLGDTNQVSKQVCRTPWSLGICALRSIRELALVSMKKPVYISVHEKANASTPNNLTQVNAGIRESRLSIVVQSYIVCEVPQKISLIWSFIKNHLKSKIIIFIQSCKQVEQ